MSRRETSGQGGDAAPDVLAGQAIYSPAVLRVYDLLVLGLSNRLVWRCPTAELSRLYDRNVSRRHLDVGVGTGLLLDRARWPVPDPQITLVDLNRHSLAAAGRRIRRLSPRAIVANILEPLPVAIGPFESVGLCYLLHCLPGRMEDKAIAFDHLRPALAPGARVFGATLVADAPRSPAARRLAQLYNRKGIFSNADDTATELDRQLRLRFEEVQVRLCGTVALFEARSPDRR